MIEAQADAGREAAERAQPERAETERPRAERAEPAAAPLCQQIGQRDPKSGAAWAFSFADATKTMAAQLSCPSQPPVSLPLRAAEVKAIITWLSSLVGQMKDPKGAEE